MQFLGMQVMPKTNITVFRKAVMEMKANERHSLNRTRKKGLVALPYSPQRLDANRQSVAAEDSGLRCLSIRSKVMLVAVSGFLWSTLNWTFLLVLWKFVDYRAEFLDASLGIHAFSAFIHLSLLLRLCNSLPVLLFLLASPPAAASGVVLGLRDPTTMLRSENNTIFTLGLAYSSSNLGTLVVCPTFFLVALSCWKFLGSPEKKIPTRRHLSPN